jgi:hypothetical protein
MANIDASPSKTIDEFCRSEGISKSTYYTMKKLGIGPTELIIPFTKVIRITSEAQTQWRGRMQEVINSKEAKLIAARRAEQTKQAGLIAAQSPKHISRRQQSKPKHRR